MSYMSRSCTLLTLALITAAAGFGDGSADGPSVKPDPATAAKQPKAASGAARRWNVTLQTGLAEAFQLTLGGVFGAGPAWQNKATLSLHSVAVKGDSVAVSGWLTRDMPGRRQDWIASLSYRYRPYRWGRQSLQFGSSLERWLFPSVLTGAKDWIGGLHGTYSTRAGSVPIQIQSIVYNTLSSPLKNGTLIHSQAWFDHALVKTEPVRLTLRHGPQHTYSWNFYGTNGHRVLRYAGALVLNAGGSSFELGYRPQYGLQQRIPDNRFWYVQMSRTF